MNDLDKSKPILIVGTHADKVPKQERAKLSAQVQQMFPTNNRLQVHGHFTLSITAGIPFNSHLLVW
jgi:hypothetical protein